MLIKNISLSDLLNNKQANANLIENNPILKKAIAGVEALIQIAGYSVANNVWNMSASKLPEELKALDYYVIKNSKPIAFKIVLMSMDGDKYNEIHYLYEDGSEKTHLYYSPLVLKLEYLGLEYNKLYYIKESSNE